MTDPTGTPERSFESNPTVCPFCGAGCAIEYAGRGSATGERRSVASDVTGNQA